jgi:hypothetical protein
LVIKYGHYNPSQYPEDSLKVLQQGFSMAWRDYLLAHLQGCPEPEVTTGGAACHLTSSASEKLLDGHPKDAGQVIDETTSHLTKAASCQVIGYGL